MYETFAERSRSVGVFPLFGLEVVCLQEDLRHAGERVNDPGNPGKTYLCGKGITQFAPMNAAASGLMSTVRSIDSDRIAAMTERLSRIFAAGGVETAVTEASLKAGVVSRYGVPADTVYLQERHVAQGFQEALFAVVGPAGRPEALARVLGPGLAVDAVDAVSVQSAIRAHLMKAGKPGYVEETFVGLDHAYQLVLALGGVPCYPVLADGAEPVCEFERPVEHLVGSLRQHRVHCAELIPNRNTVPVLRGYVQALREAGIVVLAGTEHNTADMVPMEPQCAGGEPIPEDLKDVFWEGVCVVAAHQYLTANGQTGYVDDYGEPAPAYPDAGSRIRAFAHLGAAVIEKYAGTASPAEPEVEV